ncbi:uncharacterized protein LOC113122402 [Mastacembelus armatus]|uniref:uncharacterized protein LOC113122402 n=1 Tax=Mastacembelus armatus TaxID=205130 RepID=UPI000E45496F|nr:uncharacterized protein LOC113122402 [Mastacembelus armatus]
MRIFIMETILLLCSLNWVSLSAFEFYTVGVRSGEEVTLLCSNFSSGPTQTIWFRVVKKLQPHCISHLFTSSGPASFCDGFQNGRFQMTSNSSSVFLKIQQVNVSDSGLYFCGYFIQTNPVMVGAAYLEVQDLFDGVPKLMMIPGVLTVFSALVIFGLVVKIKQLQKVHIEQNPYRRTTDTEILSSDDQNYASVTFHPAADGNLRPASETTMEPSVIYSSIR